MKLTTEQRQNMDKLIEALDSGDYQQTRNFLRARDKYCIGGVMCDLSNYGDWTKTSTNLYAFQHDGKTHHNFLPTPVMNLFGINGPTMAELQRLNDSGSTFSDLPTRAR